MNPTLGSTIVAHLTGSKFEENQAKESGALAIGTSTLTNLSRCLFSKNQATRAAAISVRGSMTISDSILRSNLALPGGTSLPAGVCPDIFGLCSLLTAGAVELMPAARSRVIRTLFEDNYSPLSPGAMLVEVSVRLINQIQIYFRLDCALQGGAAVHISQSTFSRNSASYGGANTGFVVAI